MRGKSLWMAILLIIAFAGVSYADSNAVKMTWKQPAVDLPSLLEWRVFVGDSAAEATLLDTIPYTGQTSFTVTKAITVTGAPGTKVKKYLSISAVSKNGVETSRVMGQTPDGIGYLEFVIAYPNVSVPFDVIIEVITP